MSKYYAGKRRDGIAKVFKGDDSEPHIQEELDPARSLFFRNHSPTGFEFGYGGSGPAQTALAILLDFSDDAEWAMEHYQEFKGDVVSRMPRAEDWTLTWMEIFMWIQHREEAKKHFAAKWDGARAQLVEEK